MMRTMVLAALLLAGPLAAGPAAAQPDPAARIEAAMRRAAQTGIPVALLENKVAEGRAKGVAPDRIAAVVERRLASLTRARDVMRGARGEAVSGADLSVGADALEAGVDPAVLGTLSTQAPAAHRAMAVAVLTQLVRDGLASERALERVRAALARGPEALRTLPAQAAAGRDGAARAEPPGQARRGGAVNAGRGGGRPASVPGRGGRGTPPGRGKPKT